MKSIWIKSLDVDEKKEISMSYNASGLLRQRLEKLLEEKIVAADKESYDKEGYACANWAYKQADLAGYKRAHKEIISLLK